MGSKVFQKVDFYSDFFEKRMVPNIYKVLSYKGIQGFQYKNPRLDAEEKDAQWYIKLFPSYLDFKRKDHQGLILRRIFRVKGFAIEISDFDSTDHYLQLHFKPNFRTAIRRRFKGLETCFDIRYKMFYGHIEQSEYEFLMQSLHGMLTRRFKQRNDENMALKKWERYVANTRGLINEKKASLFVIYDDSKPIQIALSYHHDKIIFLAIPSYDIDYSKFGLGNLAIVKILHWCIDNAYSMLDMGYGAFDYKVKWCNKIYNFEHHLFYRKSSPLSLLFVYFVTIKTRIINFLLTKNINVIYHDVKEFFLGRKKLQSLDYTIVKGEFNKEELSGLISIDHVSNDSYRFLKKPLYDFAYARLENVSQIKVYELEPRKVYCFVGNRNVQKIIFQNLDDI